MQSNIYIFHFTSDYDSWDEIVISDREITSNDAKQIVDNMCPPEANGGENVEVYKLKPRIMSNEEAGEKVASAGCINMYNIDTADLMFKF